MAGFLRSATEFLIGGAEFCQESLGRGPRFRQSLRTSSHDRVHKVVELAAVPALRDPYEVADERRVRPLAALVRGDPGERKEVVDVFLGQRVLRGVGAHLAREPIDGGVQPRIHGRKP